MNGLTTYNFLRAMPFTLINHNIGNVDSIGNVILLAGQERTGIKPEEVEKMFLEAVTRDPGKLRRPSGRT
jgi:ATP-dependent protease ClpP protease subunit